MQNNSELNEAINFHGHLCPGLVIGFKAGQIALSELNVNRSEDEELVAIVETDACSIDAIQILTGCTAGKGNFLVKNYGKQVFTIGNRKTGQAVRVALKPEVLGAIGEIDKETRAEELFSESPDQIFKVEKIDFNFPDMAEIRDSVECEICSEPVMETKARLKNGKVICIPCFKSE
ncbi:FmdE family protein [Selenihalanaerobacter shriftii]|uniref:Formylmethanofuran dehydrogenase subunit E n=1 Tax=Selenihalanaerobacter shriftii TaxID=142842 RepID=A0A1T4JL53_9FIRM|nr:FmdE family protein [Selenihalanaerobacter shriftii]SJZ30833.1 formylmethanofuran dehydrogenase subunit E [Selenihalanaerobacter shriftii]